MVTEEQVRDQLRTVVDPELGMDLVELGLIYGIGVHDGGKHVDVLFSLASPMCPVGDQIQTHLEAETLSVEGVETVNAQLTFEPGDDESGRQALLRPLARWRRRAEARDHAPM